MIVEDQSEVLEFLSRPAAYGDAPGKAVERIDTHISSVFLVGCRAFKLKRAVRFSYLDFSTAELRRAACLEEVACNGRAAPELYIGILPVTRDGNGRLALGGEGEAVDWVVEMVRFERELCFDRLAAEGRLDRRLMEDLAEVIARFHQAAEPRAEYGGERGLRYVTESNADCFAEAPGGMFDPDRLEVLRRRTADRLAALAPLLEARRAAGRVRHCHGDLHLRNVCMMAEGGTCLGAPWEVLSPVPFDGIEFNPMIANIDVLYDLAFMVMDLDHHGHRRLASILLNRYVDLTGDVEGLAALPLFLSVRAAVRAHVGGAAMATIADPGERETIVAESRAYLERALSYLDTAPPRLVAVGGLSGSGKSRMARELAPHLGMAPGALVVRSDVLRKRLFGVHILDRLPAEAYGPETAARTYAALYDEVARALAAGRCVIADAVFSKPDERAAIAEVAARAGVPFDGLWLEAPPEVMVERVTRRRHNASDADARVVTRQLDYDLGEIAWARIDSSGPGDGTLAGGLTAIGLAGGGG